MATKGKLEQPQFSEEQIKNILSYTNEIVSLESFVAAVRETPDVYIGSLGNWGFTTLGREVFQNGTDEMQKPQSTCDMVTISFDERSKWIIVEDNGRGFPHGRIIDIITKDHTSSNYNKVPFNYTAGKNGMGIGIVNALSSEFIVESSILGVTHRVEFKEGIPWDKGEIVVKSKKYQGSVVSFRPCIPVLGDITVVWQDIFFLVSAIVPTLKIGAKVVFNAIDSMGVQHSEVLINTDGILTHLINMCQTPMIAPVYGIRDTGEMKCEFVFTYTSEDTSYIVQSYNNYCPTNSGTHENGFKEGLCKFFKNYINKFVLNGNKKLQIINDDVLAGLRVVVNTCLLKPKYDGQNKEILNNPEITPFCAKVAYDTLDEWYKKNPKDLQKICKWIKDIAELRTKDDAAKIKISNNYKKSIVGGNLPANYTPPTSKNTSEWELLIVEGNSAGGCAKNACKSLTQGVFGIRGKFPNAMTTPRAKMLANAEASSIISILDNGRGVNYGSKFDLNLCPYKRVIIMTDADEDGIGHIRPLLCKFFLVYMAPLIMDGRLYSACPPLYYAEIGSGKSRKVIYFNSDAELSDYINKIFSKNNIIEDLNKKRLTPTQISQLILRNMNYIDMVDHICSSLAIEPHLLEVILHNYRLGYKKLKSVIEKKWRFLKVETVNNTMIISGAMNRKTWMVPVNDRLLGMSMQLEQLMAKSDVGYIVNGVPMSLYDTIIAFQKLKPANIKRFKGLGEMNKEQLRESTVHPDYNRTLIRYTIDDIKKEINEIRKIESDFSILLNDIRRVRKEDMF